MFGWPVRLDSLADAKTTSNQACKTWPICLIDNLVGNLKKSLEGSREAQHSRREHESLTKTL